MKVVLGLAMFFCLTAVAVRRNAEQTEPQVGTRPVAITQVQKGVTTAVTQAQSGGPASPDDIRFWVERCLAMVCHLAVVLALLMIGVRHFADTTAGMAAGTLYLLLPYTAFHIGQFHHVWPTAFLMWAVFCYRRPGLSGWLLGLAAGSAFFPLLLFPLWVWLTEPREPYTLGAAIVTALLLGYAHRRNIERLRRAVTSWAKSLWPIQWSMLEKWLQSLK